MRMFQDRVEVEFGVGCEHCEADEEERSPFDIDECPMGYEWCDAYCDYYTERWEEMKEE